MTTSVEVRTEQNGVIEVTEERRTEETIGQQPVNGIVEDHQPVQPPPPPPPLFDMDLERMHVELYRDKYLTLEDFIQDIRKMVHNAYVRSHEDGERLFRAQAMLTAAEVSMNDFDPQFRLECQRMAERERKRRQERRKDKGKGKAVENGLNGASSQAYAPGTRRSARNNGQQPEISITDPLLLERKLKRQRPNEAAATPSDDESGERLAKRSKMAAPEDNDHDPLDLLASSPSPQRPPGVRFADEVQRLRTPSPPPPIVNGILHDVSREASPRKMGGFPPSLLNPLPSPTDIPSLGPAVDDNPFLSHEAHVVPQTEQSPGPSSIQSIQLDPQPAHDSDVVPQPSMEISVDPQPVEVSVEVPVEIERSPTPLPDFHLDEDLLSILKITLRDGTAPLVVEQLEQLRATCLGCIWRHRTEWDRTAVTRELIEVVNEFVDEVTSDDMDSLS